MIKMFISFKEIEKKILDNKVVATIALAGSHDEDALASIVYARRKNIVKAIMIGDEKKTKDILLSMGEDELNYEFINETNEGVAAKKACQLVAQKKADIPMKGLIQTSIFLRPILEKDEGFVPNKGLISQATVYEYRKKNKLLIISDCAINIEPTYEEKFKITENAVKLSRQLGNPCPYVAIIAPMEMVNPKIQSTVDAAMLSKAGDRKQIKSCIIDGPLGLDNAVSEEAAKHKGIVSNAAGQADILIMPDLGAGNIFTKSLVYFGDGSPSSGTIAGTSVGVVMTSRSETAENKYNSILIALLQSNVIIPGNGGKI